MTASTSAIRVLLCCESQAKKPPTLISKTIAAMMLLRSRACRRLSRSARRKTSSDGKPMSRATTLASARSRPSPPRSRRSAPIGCVGVEVTMPSAVTSKRSAGGKQVASISPIALSAISGITGRSGWRHLNSRTSSLTGPLIAASGETMITRAAEASSASMVWLVSVPPAEKSCRSRKIGRKVVGIGPMVVIRPAMSLSTLNASSQTCTRLAVTLSLLL